MNEKKSVVPAPPPGGSGGQLIEPGAMLQEFGKDIMLWERENPRSFVHLVPQTIARKFEDARFEKPEYFEEPDEQTLLALLNANNGRINATDNRLRLKLWLEYDYTHQFHVGHIDIKRVCAGICSPEFFQNKYLSCPEKAAWLLCPPAGYMAKINEALEFGVQQLRDVLGFAHQNGTKLDPKVAEIKLKIVMFLDARKNGGILQKTMNLHAHTSDKGAASAAIQGALQPTMDQMQSRLDALRREKEALQNGGTLVLPAEAVKKIDS